MTSIAQVLLQYQLRQEDCDFKLSTWTQLKLYGVYVFFGESISSMTVCSTFRQNKGWMNQRLKEMLFWVRNFYKQVESELVRNDCRLFTSIKKDSIRRWKDSAVFIVLKVSVKHSNSWHSKVVCRQQVYMLTNMQSGSIQFLLRGCIICSVLYMCRDIWVYWL